MKLKFLALKVASYFLSWLPNRVVILLGCLIGIIWYYLIPIRRHTVLENMTLAFGDSKSDEEIQKLASKFFRHMGCVLVESLRSIVWTAEDFRKKVSLEGFEHIEPYLKENKGGFLVSLHLGCWELAPGSGVSHGVPVDVVTKYARHEESDPFLQWFRNRLGVNLIPETRSTPMILGQIAKGRWIGFMMDQFMGPPIGIPITFFGKCAGTTASLAVLTEKHAIPSVLAYTYRDKRGRMHTVIEPIKFPPFSEDLTKRVWEKTQAINDLLEKKVREHPEQWMWLHRRWKPFQGTPKWNLAEGPLMHPITT